MENSVMTKLFVVVSIAICVRFVQGTQNCTASCEALEAGTKIPDPEDCRSYFVCLEDELPSDSTITCPAGQYFDVGTQSCSDTKPLSCRPCSHCRTRCSDAINDLISNPLDCNSFYVCLLGETLKASCNANQFFNGSTCTDEPADCCNPCLVYCPEGGIEVYDPYDCTMYYLCEEEGVPDETHHLKCPPESPVYDRELHRCGEGDSTCVDDAGSNSINPCMNSSLERQDARMINGPW